MRTTLKLVEYLLARARMLHNGGQDSLAYPLLKRLAGFRSLPAKTAEETQALLAEIQFNRQRSLRARRHLAAALGYHPDNSRYHYLMGSAVDADDRGDPQRALAHYRRSLKLDPDQPSCLVDYGLLCLELKRDQAGLRALRKAARLAPDDSETLAGVVEGLCHVERDEEARRLLIAARFRNRRDSRFERLWEDFQFQQLGDAQASARRERKPSAAVILPFKRSGLVKRVRRDRPSPLPKPHGPRRIRIYQPQEDL
jgi:tetratricopeptide (TPR) repeat protein